MIKLSPSPGTGTLLTDYWKKLPVEYGPDGKPIIPTARAKQKEKPPRKPAQDRPAPPSFTVTRISKPPSVPPVARSMVVAKKALSSHARINVEEIECKTAKEMAELVLERYQYEINSERTIRDSQPFIRILENVTNDIPISSFDFKPMKQFLVHVGISAHLAKTITEKLQGVSTLPEVESHGQPENVFLLACNESGINLKNLNFANELKSYKIYQDFLTNHKYERFASLANGLCVLFQDGKFNSFSQRLEIIGFLRKTSQNKNLDNINFIHNLIALKQEHDVEGIDRMFFNTSRTLKKGRHVQGLYFESEVALNLLRNGFTVLSLSNQQLTSSQGDIDIVASSGDKKYYIEVKSTYEAIAGHSFQYSKLKSLARGNKVTPVLLIPRDTVQDMLDHNAIVPMEITQFLKSPSAEVWNEFGQNVSGNIRHLANLVAV